jgi:hypothetical protein
MYDDDGQVCNWIRTADGLLISLYSAFFVLFVLFVLFVPFVDYAFLSHA